MAPRNKRPLKMKIAFTPKYDLTVVKAIPSTINPRPPPDRAIPVAKDFFSLKKNEADVLEGSSNRWIQFDFVQDCCFFSGKMAGVEESVGDSNVQWPMFNLQ